jgi:intein/homing endonuclease
MMTSNDEFRKEGKTINTVKIINPKTNEEVSFFLEPWVKDRFDKKVIPDLEKKDKDCVIAIDGKEGCLFEDTLIKTSLGNKKIKNLLKEKEFFVESLDIDNNKLEKGKAKCIYSGEKELFEIETDDGRIVKATKDHKFFVLKNNKIKEVKLSDLKEGDELICQ